MEKIVVVGREVEIFWPQRVIRNSLTEKQIETLEDETKPMLTSLFNAREQRQLQSMGRREYAEYLRNLLVEDAW